jgi:hypothetical protein
MATTAFRYLDHKLLPSPSKETLSPAYRSNCTSFATRKLVGCCSATRHAPLRQKRVRVLYWYTDHRALPFLHATPHLTSFAAIFSLQWRTSCLLPSSILLLQ